MKFQQYPIGSMQGNVQDPSIWVLHMWTKYHLSRFFGVSVILEGAINI